MNHVVLREENVIRLLNVDELAMVTGWKPTTIRQKVWRREIAFVKLGRNIRFRQDVIERMINEGEIPPRGRQG